MLLCRASATLLRTFSPVLSALLLLRVPPAVSESSSAVV
jgi:hypothetical protein